MFEDVEGGQRLQEFVIELPIYLRLVVHEPPKFLFAEL
jgi:hypothetical protein